MQMRPTIASMALMAITAAPFAMTSQQATAAPMPSKTMPTARAKVFYATGSVNVRTGPGTGNRSIGVLKKGYRVGNAGAAKGAWQPVNYKGRTAWVAKKYLTAAPVKMASSTVTPRRAAVTSSVRGKAFYSTGSTNVRTGPGTGYRAIGLLKKGYRVGNAGPAKGAWQPVNYKGRTAWVAKKYLTTTPVKMATPKVTPRRAAVTSSVRGNVSMPSGVNGNAYNVASAVRSNFPQISSMGGGRSGGGDHGTGRAVDIMIPNYRSNQALGSSIANYMRANASRLGITYVIWDQKIWSVQRSGEGWRYMSNRGSDNANHKNHVHVSVR